MLTGGLYILITGSGNDHTTVKNQSHEYAVFYGKLTNADNKSLSCSSYINTKDYLKLGGKKKKKTNRDFYLKIV